MEEIIRKLIKDLAWAENDLSNLNVSLRDAMSKVKNLKDWIKSEKKLIEELQKP